MYDNIHAYICVTHARICATSSAVALKISRYLAFYIYLRLKYSGPTKTRNIYVRTWNFILHRSEIGLIQLEISISVLITYRLPCRIEMFVIKISIRR